MEKRDAQITCYDVTKNFKQGQTDITVLHHVSAQFAQGNSYALTGVSGSGKSTLLTLLAGLDAPTSGSVLYNAENINEMTDKRRALFLNQTVGLVFQSPYILHELNVIENVMIKGLIAQQPFLACQEKARALLATVGLAQKESERPASLSGGQQQRVAIARALFTEPTFLLADEPTGNLDEKTGREIIDFLLECQERWGMGMIISSHDQDLARRMNHLFLLHEGHLTQEK